MEKTPVYAAAARAKLCHGAFVKESLREDVAPAHPVSGVSMMSSRGACLRRPGGHVVRRAGRRRAAARSRGSRAGWLAARSMTARTWCGRRAHQAREAPALGASATWSRTVGREPPQYLRPARGRRGRGLSSTPAPGRRHHRLSTRTSPRAGARARACAGRRGGGGPGAPEQSQNLNPNQSLSHRVAIPKSRARTPSPARLPQEGQEKRAKKEAAEVPVEATERTS